LITEKASANVQEMDEYRTGFFTSQKSMAEVLYCFLPFYWDWLDVFSQASFPGFS
jgi:hypothetical protein